MDVATILGLVGGGIALAAGGGVLGKTLWTKYKALSADNARWNTLQGAKDIWDDLRAIWAEHQGDIQEFVGQTMALSKAVTKQTKAVERINMDDKLRKALVDAAQGFGPAGLDALSAVLTPVPAEIRNLAGMDTDKLSKLVAAQQEQLSKKEATNQILESSGKMATSIAKAVASVAPLLMK